VFPELAISSKKDIMLVREEVSMSSTKKFSADEWLQFFIEGFKSEANIAQICRQNDIYPSEYYRFRRKALQGAVQALKNGRGKKDREKETFKKEIEKLKDILLSQAQEISILKKKTNSDY
jgi:transposase-like protein